MPAPPAARSPQEAIDRYRERLQRSLATISSSAVWFPYHEPDDTYRLLTPTPIEIVRANGATLFLHVATSFIVEPEPGGRTYRVRTTSYSYSLSLSDLGDTRLAWHWHPEPLGPPFTHAHVYLRDEIIGSLGKWHIPTSRVLFEQVARFLIADLEVQPTDPDWERVLLEIQHDVEAVARWRGDAP